jgi:hypothetical protein
MDSLTTGWKIFIAAIAIWELIWKGFALWRAGRNNQPGWFIAMLLINSAGILPIMYLLTHRDNSAAN